MKRVLLIFCLLITLPCMAFEVDTTREDQEYLEKEYKEIIDEAYTCITKGKCDEELYNNLDWPAARNYFYLDKKIQQSRYDIIGIYKLMLYMKDLPQSIDIQYGLEFLGKNEMGCRTKTDALIDYLSKINEPSKFVKYVNYTTQYINGLGYFSDYRIVDLYAYILTQLNASNYSRLRGWVGLPLEDVKKFNVGRSKARYKYID